MLIPFDAPLQHGVLLRRYKRFFADVQLDDGRELTLHCPNTGSMLGCAEPGSQVWVSVQPRPGRKLPGTWELVECAEGGWACIHSARANRVVEQALQAGLIEPLAGALDRFAERTGLSFAYRSDTVAGLSSPGLTGSFSATEGLRRLLAGTGTAFQFTGASTVTIIRPEAQGAVTLDTVAVEGRRAHETASGPVEGFVATRSATGTKTDTPLIETPQAINVVTRDQMEAQGSTTLTESLRYTPGVIAQYGNNDVRHDWLTVRGFTPGRYLDGMRLPFGARGYSQPRIEPFGLERVEVLKGPASLLYGQGNPGGTVNMVKKRPTEEEVREIELQTGSFDRMQAAIDLGGKANDEGTLLYRMVALGRKSDTQFDYVEEEKVYVAPSLTWLASDNTKVTFFGEYQEIDAPGGGG